MIERDPEIDEVAPVRYFTLCGGWQTGQTWPPESESVELFLSEGGGLAKLPPAVAEGSDVYTADFDATSGKEIWKTKRLDL